MKTMTTEESIALDSMKQIGIESSLDVLRSADTVLALLKKSFDDMSIFVEGEYNDNGADFLQCPGCCKRVEVVGTPARFNEMTSVKHDEDCTLKALYDLTKALT